MFTVVVTKKNTRRILTVIVLILLVIIGFTVYGSVKRRLYAVKGGVTVEGQDFSGLFRQEAYEKLEEMAGTFYKSPSDAFYLSETGEIISENYGIQVNVMETLDAVMSASKGEEIKLSVSTVAPSVTSDMMKPIYSVNTDRKAVAKGTGIHLDARQFIIGMSNKGRTKDRKIFHHFFYREKSFCRKHCIIAFHRMPLTQHKQIAIGVISILWADIHLLEIQFHQYVHDAEISANMPAARVFDHI